jgi:tetratricopeptide (TPR) repeat protein
VDAMPPSSPAPLEAWEMLDLLASLVEKSLVVYEQDEQGVGRYRLLETVRQYARDRLLEAGEADAVRAQHVRYFLSLAQAERAATRAGGVRRFDQVEEENFRSALEWCRAQCEAAGPPAEARAPSAAASGLQLVTALWWPWFLRSLIRETCQYLGGFLSFASEAAVGAEVRAEALNGAGFLTSLQGEYEEARSYLEQGLALAESLPGPLLGTVLYNLANVMMNLGDDDRSRHLQQRALALRREMGHKWGVGWSLIALAQLARREGGYEEAAALQEESLGLFREIGDPGATAGALEQLGRTCLAAGDPAPARRHLTESLRLRRAGTDQIAVSDSLEALASLWLHEGRGERAAQLLGAAEGLRRAVGSALHPMAAGEHERVVAALREALGDERFAGLWAIGEVMSLEEATAAALEEDPSS